MIVRTYGIYDGSSGDITSSVVSSKFLAPVTTFRQYLERIPPQSQPMFRFILLAFAVAGRIDTVFKSNVDREKLLLRLLPRRHDLSKSCLQELRPLLSQQCISRNEMKQLICADEERKQIVEMFSSPISLQERCLQVVRVT